MPEEYDHKSSMGKMMHSKKNSGAHGFLYTYGDRADCLRVVVNAMNIMGHVGNLNPVLNIDAVCGFAIRKYLIFRILLKKKC